MDAIILRGVRTHNLKNFDLILPHHRFYVITGVSGSGKSSLAFDTLYAEGQRRFVESLSAYARQFLERMERPDTDSVSGIPPAIAIEAKNVITNARSTVGTQTEVNDYLRLLFCRVGVTVCPDCRVEVTPNNPGSVASFLLARHGGQKVFILFEVPLGAKAASYRQEALAELERQGFSLFKDSKPDPLSVCVDEIFVQEKNRRRLIDSLESAFRHGRGSIKIVGGNGRLDFSEGLRCYQCGRSFREPVPNLFSFNSPLGACPVCQGFGRVITIDWNLVIPDESKSIAEGAIEPWTKPGAAWEFRHLLKFCDRKKIPKNKPWKALSETYRRWILEGIKGDEDFYSVREYFESLQKKTYKMHVRIFLAKYRGFIPCTACGESRLKPEALAVRVRGKTIVDLQSMSLSVLREFLESLEWSPSERERVEAVILEIKRRVRFLTEVGLGYLSLSRLSRTLSGGEVERIHLATSLGSALVDTLYVLDEPSIGLHERDNQRLIRLLRELRDLGNTVVVVEHDRTMIESADEVIDLGPSGGEGGGRIVFQGKVEELKKNPHSLTGEYLAGKREIARRRSENDAGGWITIKGARAHNLKGINVRIPLQKFVVISGVSGSGKSTLLYEVLYHHFLRARGRPVQDLGACEGIEGLDQIEEMVLVDQSPIGRTPRSNPATYLKAYDEIRKIFAKLPEARREGFGPSHFSFNVDGGRCLACKGDGRVKIEMHFLADVYVPCETCRGKRFQPSVLDIRHQGKNVDDILAMTVDEAFVFFSGERKLLSQLLPLRKVGLGYLRLGQSTMTLSGGEAQRLKLACELAERKGKRLLYLFDEPTTGLHDHDIHYLMEALEELLKEGHSLLMIEHHRDIIRSADHVIDLGPEGGEQGGSLVYQGKLEGLIECAASHTGRLLSGKMAGV